LKRSILFAVVAILTAVTFSRVWRYGFVNCDDYDYALNRHVEQGLCLPSAEWAVQDVSQGIWMPVTWLSYMADYSLHRGSPQGMHIHNVLLHSINACLLFYLLLMTFQSVRGSSVPCALAALLWSVHPLRCESVAWIASRKDVLSMFWELLALVFWAKKLAALDGQRQKWYAKALVCFFLSSLAKPSCMTFPLLAAIYEFFVSPRRTKLEWRDYILPMGYAVVVGVVAQYAQSTSGATDDTSGIPFSYRFLNACAAYGLYLFHTVWPTKLAIQCLMRYPEPPRFLLQGLAVVSGVLVLTIWHIARHVDEIKKLKPVSDFPLAFALFFTVAVGPFLGLSGFGYHAFADRFTYVPSVGICFLVPWACHAIRPKKLCWSLLAVVVSCLMVLAHNQCKYFENDETLYLRTLAVDGDGNYVAHNSLVAYYYEFPHDTAKVIEHFEKSFAARPDRVGEYCVFNIVSLCERGEVEKAREWLGWMMKWWSGLVAGEFNTTGKKEYDSLRAACAAVAMGDGDLELAEEHLSFMQKHWPGRSMVHYLEGCLKRRQGDEEGCYAEWRKISGPGDKEPYVWHRFALRQAKEGSERNLE
jgi:hypothetical protein